MISFHLHGFLRSLFNIFFNMKSESILEVDLLIYNLNNLLRHRNVIYFYN